MNSEPYLILSEVLLRRASIIDVQLAIPAATANVSATKPVHEQRILKAGGLFYDSRKVQQGGVYFALDGIHTDGHNYIQAAINNGAKTIVYRKELAQKDRSVSWLRAQDTRVAMSALSAAWYNYPSQELCVIGVTGTEGKSSTVSFISQLLELCGERSGYISTVQYKIDEQERWNSEHQTTPEATSIHQRLAQMRDAGLRYAVLESSSHGLSPRTSRLADVAFDVGVMTNVRHEHLEFHGSIEQYRHDKANLFRMLEASDHDKGRAGKIPPFTVLNADDQAAELFTKACRHPAFTFSAAGADADLSLRAITSEADGNRWTVYVRAEQQELVIRDHLSGAFNASNLMATLLVCSQLCGKQVSELAPLVEKIRPVRGRMSAIELGQGFEVLIDYAHTPSSFEAVLPSIAERIHAQKGKLIVLFGSGGERDRDKRPMQGEVAAQWADLVILADEDPRGEDPMALLEEIAAGCSRLERGKSLLLIPDRAKAIRAAIANANNGDAVLLLGKGHENSIIYADRTIYWNESEEAEKALREAGYGAKQ